MAKEVVREKLTLKRIGNNPFYPVIESTGNPLAGVRKVDLSIDDSGTSAVITAVIQVKIDD